MGFYVFVNVSFDADGYDTRYIQEFANDFKHAYPEMHPYVVPFIEDIISGKSFFTGNKGSICSWGGVFNYFDSDQFIAVLEPFWLACYRAGIIADYQHITILTDPENSNPAEANILHYNETSKTLNNVKYALPFKWRFADEHLYSKIAPEDNNKG